MTNSCDLLKRRPERIVVTGFRNIMAACDLGDMHGWEVVWQHYIAELGHAPARRMMGELQYWTRSIRQHSERRLSYNSECCRHLCHDECMALSTIAAAQAGDTATGQLAACYLTGHGCPARLSEIWEASLSFADALGQAGQFVYPVTADVVDWIFRMQQASGRHATRSRLN